MECLNSAALKQLIFQTDTQRIYVYGNPLPNVGPIRQVTCNY